MKIIAGLGNPGNQYNFTRHNAGFLALDFYFKQKGLSWAPRSRFNALYLKDGDNVYVKPQGFYNTSGEPIAAFLRYYKLTPKDLLVICDDFTLEFGKLRLREKGSAGGNNGLKSIIQQLGTPDFPRLRLGTGNDALRKTLGDTDFVLSRFTPEEKSSLPDILGAVSAEIDAFLA